jgi:tripartite-type tricarboxylate transporter receptor subunit TctC
VREAVADPKFQAQLAAQSVEAIYGAPMDLKRRVADDNMKVRSLVTELGLLHKF